MTDEVLIIGGGPSGLATAGCLQRRGVAARILEAGPEVANSWANYYDRVRLHTGKHLSSLPNVPMGRGYPLYVPRDDLVRYLRDYARRLNLAVSTNERVLAVERAPTGGWRVETRQGLRQTPALVVATGSFDKPVIPHFPGQEEFGGTIVHTAAYRNPSSLAGQRVLVVGVGNSGAEIAVELADAGREVAIAIRSGINIVPRDLYGILPIQYLSYLLRRLPPRLAQRLAARTEAAGARRLREVGIPKAAHSALSQVPVIGLDLPDRIKRGRIAVRGGIDHLAPGRVILADGREEPYDAILLATGYAWAVDFLRPIADNPASLVPEVGVACASEPSLFFVGMHRTTQGVLYLVSRSEAPEAARLITRQLRGAATNKPASAQGAERVQ